jgi:hypothetical protein
MTGHCVGSARDAAAEEPFRNQNQTERAEIAIGSELERLFNPVIFSPPSSFQGAEVRRWRDNTGSYEVEGRLAVIFADKVRIMKPNGRTTTVSMNRLSAYDQEYVRWVAARMMSGASEPIEYADSRNQSGNPNPTWFPAR